MTAVRAGNLYNLLVTGAAAAVFCALVGQYVIQSNNVARFKAKSSSMLISAAQVKSQSAPPPANLDKVRAALAAKPLNAALVNVGIYSQALNRGAPFRLRDEDVALLKSLGWRHTPTLQNLTVAAIERQDVGNLVDISDALLRRGQLVREAMQLLNAAEVFPKGRQIILQKLALDPVWRTGYLKATEDLKEPRQADARAKLFAMIAKTPDPPTIEEIGPTLNLLVSQGKAPVAYQLWTTSQNVRPAMIQDTEFAAAYSKNGDDQTTLPFEWTFFSGSGFWAEIVQVNPKRQELMIHWDGRGVPVFASQHLWLPKGMRALVMEGRDLNEATLSRFGFSLRCPQGDVRLARSSPTQPNKVVYTLPQGITCRSPALVLNGLPQNFSQKFDRFRVSGGEDIVLTVESIKLQ
ncbi:hypothetical protein [Blastomonas sp. AAP53]|uniref:hypothetical protein n=1 Tax=Blastomonas sp. AAP53 TaxID=1248760 RepID=UPI0002E350F0|nr:hypothetical protein [Blastomonas sp. AAP53]